jgi:hypothetical protein
MYKTWTVQGKGLKTGHVDFSGKVEHEWRKIYSSSVCGVEKYIFLSSQNSYPILYKSLHLENIKE